MSTSTLRSARLIAAGTLLRVAAVPVVMALVLVDADGAAIVAAVLFALAAATDFFDGYLARRWRVTTMLGSFLDTTADKLLVCGVLIALVAVDRASPWIVALIVARELVVLCLRAAVAAEGANFAPSPWGKVKAGIQFAAIVLAILRPGEPIVSAYLDEWAMLAAAVITVVSAVEYFTRFGSTLTAPSEHGT